MAGSWTPTTMLLAMSSLLLGFSHPTSANKFIFSQRLRTDLGGQNNRQFRAIPSLSSSKDSAGSFVVQMPFSVVSEKVKPNDYDNTWSESTRNQFKQFDTNPKLVSLGGSGPKINFYTIKCRRGESCSSIIPAQIVTNTPKVTDLKTNEEMKQYLKSLNLENGFGFSDNVKNDLAARYFLEDKKIQENSRKSRKYQIGHFNDYDEYWPGSNLRPNRNRDFSQEVNSDSFRQNKFNERSYNLPSPFSSISASWPKGVHIISQDNPYPIRSESGRKISSQIPSPTFSNALEWPYSLGNLYTNTASSSSNLGTVPHSITVNSDKNRKWTVPDNYKFNSKIRPGGEWRRFSESTVTQLDKDSGKWLKVSNNHNNVDQTDEAIRPYLDKHYKRPTIFHNNRPALHDQNIYHSNQDSTSTMKHTSTGLTVLGVTESNTATATTPILETSSSHGNFPIRPWGNSHNDKNAAPRPTIIPGRPPRPLIPVSALTHVSSPLYVLAADPSSAPVSIDPSTALAAAQAAAASSAATPTTQRAARRTTKITTTTQAPAGGGGQGGDSILSNPYAVIAAVGAGLIPATFAALLPVFLGKRRRRRSLDSNEDKRKSSALALAFSPELPDVLDDPSNARLRPHNWR